MSFMKEKRNMMKAVVDSLGVSCKMISQTEDYTQTWQLRAKF